MYKITFVDSQVSPRYAVTPDKLAAILADELYSNPDNRAVVRVAEVDEIVNLNSEELKQFLTDNIKFLNTTEFRNILISWAQKQ